MQRARAVPLVALILLGGFAAVRGLRRRVPDRPAAAASAPGSPVVDSAWREPGLPVARWRRRDAGVVDAAVAASPPTTLHGDARRTHRARAVGPARPDVAWRARVARTHDGGAPAEGIVAQVVTSPDEKVLYVATLDGDLVALAREDGAVRFRVALGGRAYGTPAVAPDGTVYVGSDARALFAVAPTGAIRFRLELDDEVDTSPLLLGSGLVIVAAGRTLYAVRPLGDVAWRVDVKKKIFTAPALAGGLVVVGAQDHRVHAVTPAGKAAWSTDLGADVDGSPSVGDDEATFVGTDGDEVVRLAPDGGVAWRARVGGFVRGPLSVTRDGDVLAGVYGPLPRQVRLDGADGGLRGQLSVQGTGAREFGVHGGALEDDEGTVFFGAQDDAVYAVGSDGVLRWRFTTRGDVDAPLTLLGDGSLIVPSDEGFVYLLHGPR